VIAALGWTATALFASSYLFKRPATLRRVQALGAVLWIVYGAVIHAPPVVAANLIVAGAALWSARGTSGRPAREPTAAPQAAGD